MMAAHTAPRGDNHQTSSSYFSKKKKNKKKKGRPIDRIKWRRTSTVSSKQSGFR
jgi:hypothetical protein